MENGRIIPHLYSFLLLPPGAYGSAPFHFSFLILDSR
jgi:hypothetical protein